MCVHIPEEVEVEVLEDEGVHALKESIEICVHILEEVEVEVDVMESEEVGFHI